MKKMFVHVAFAVVFLCSAQGDEFTARDGVKSDTPAKKWQEALVSGNGIQGVMVFGDPYNERIVLNHEKFYEPRRNKPAKAPDIARNIPKVRQLQMAGKYQEASDFYWEKCVEAGHDAILWTEPYHPGYAITMKTSASGSAADYRRTCNFRTGEVTVRWSDAGGDFVRRTFVSRTQNVIVQEFKGPRVSCTLNLESQGLKEFSKQKPQGNKPSWQGDKRLDGVLDPEISVQRDWMSYRLGYKQTAAGYEGATRVVIDGGSSSVTDEGLRIEGAIRVLLLTKLVRLDDFSKSNLGQTRKKLNALTTDYDALLRPHAAVHGAMYDRVSINLGGSIDDHERSNETLIALQKTLPKGVSNKALLEKVFNMGRYTLISASGDFPPNLQALWNGEFQPAWSGDFTLDANLNLQIAAASLAGLPEAVQSYANLMVKMRPDWQENAMRFYGSSGLMAPPRTSGVDGHNYHLSPNFPSGAWTAGGQWLVLPMIEAYETTGDKEFLKETVMPFVLGLAKFYEDFLTLEDENGKVVFSPSYSPEQGPEGLPPMVFNATMDVAAGKEALTYAIRLSNELGVNQDKIETWNALLKKIPEYRINEDGALAEWIPEDMQDHYDHRHVSHLYPLWPGHEINPEETPELFDAAVVAAQKRGRGNGSAHGLSHMALIAARLKQADLVAGNLSFILSNDYLLPSLFTQHNPNWLFNADALHSLPAVVMEMLVYSRPGVIELFPALDESFSKGEINGLCTRSQITVESLQWDLEAGTATITLFPLKSQEITLRIRGGIQSVKKDNVSVPLRSPTTVQLKLNKQETTMIGINLRLDR